MGELLARRRRHPQAPRAVARMPVGQLTPHHRCPPLPNHRSPPDQHTAIPPNASAMDSQRIVSRCDTNGKRTAPLRLAKDILVQPRRPRRQRLATRPPAPFQRRFSASTSRAGRVSAAKAVAQTGELFNPKLRAGPRSNVHEPRAGIIAKPQKPDLRRALERPDQARGSPWQMSKGHAVHSWNALAPPNRAIVLW